MSFYKEVHMTMQGQGESQPGEGEVSLDSLANELDGSDESPVELDAGDESEEAEVIEDEEQPEEGEDEEQEEATVALTHDGKEITVKQSELIELGQKGLDYTKKTMAVAEERKAVEAESAKVSALRAQVEAAHTESIGRLEAFRSYMQEQLGSPPPVEWASTDAGYYIAQKESYEQRKGQLQQAEAAIEHLKGEQHRQRQAHIAKQAQDAVEHLKSTLPDWTENTLPELEKYVNEQGLTAESMEAGYVQKSLWTMAHKAKAYDEIMAKKATMKPVAQLQKVVRPQANNQPQSLARRQEAVKRHNANPSISTLADLL